MSKDTSSGFLLSSLSENAVVARNVVTKQSINAVNYQIASLRSQRRFVFSAFSDRLFRGDVTKLP